MKDKNVKNFFTNLGISILVLVILSLVLILLFILHKMLALPPIWTAIITILIISGCLWFLSKWLQRMKRPFSVVAFLILGIGFIFVILSYYKSLWENPAYNVSVFGTGVAIITLGIAFLALFYPWPSEAVAIDKVIKDSNSRLQELTTKMLLIDKVIKELNNKMQQQNTKIQMMDKTTKDIDSKIQKLDTKIQTLIDMGRQKR